MTTEVSENHERDEWVKENVRERLWQPGQRTTLRQERNGNKVEPRDRLCAAQAASPQRHGRLQDERKVAAATTRAEGIRLRGSGHRQGGRAGT